MTSGGVRCRTGRYYVSFLIRRYFNYTENNNNINIDIMTVEINGRL